MTFIINMLKDPLEKKDNMYELSPEFQQEYRNYKRWQNWILRFKKKYISEMKNSLSVDRTQ